MTKNLTCKICGRPRKKGQRKCDKCKAREKREERANSIPILKKEADRVFSKFIRNRDMWTCQTCGIQIFGSNAHCSHFVGRNNMATRYEEKNCICQCAKENMFMEGNKPKFALVLMKKYGTGIIEELVKQGNTTIKADAQFFKDIIKKYDPQTKTRD